MNKIVKIEAGEHVREVYMPYAMSTILDRALPDIRDGLKPVHRRILYAMYKSGITSNKERAKTTEPISETMKIHHHGDASILDAIALMTEQNESLLHPYIDGEGAFGKVYSKDKPSAPRYTYCRLNGFAMEHFKDLNKDILQMIGEDKDHLQPLVLSSSFPNLLIKNNSGIACGEACDFPSFNFKEVCDTTIAYIENKDINLIDYLSALDFSTGGYLIYDKNSLEKIYNTGMGSVILRAKYNFDEKNNCIDIYEIPYSTTIEAICSKIITLMKTDIKFKSVLDVRDETGFNIESNREEMKITIDVKKNTNIESLMTNLFISTPLQSNYSANMNCLVNYEPKVLGVKQILDEWLKFRVECITQSLQYDINNKTEKLHLLLGLEKVLLDIDKCISIIRHSDENKMIKNLCKEFEIDDIQSENISNMKLRNINKDYIVKQIKDIKKLNDEVKDLNYKVSHEKEINKIIIDDLIRVRDTYSKPRKTEILYTHEIKQIDNQELVPDYSTTIVFTQEQYIKKTLRYAEKERQKVKDNDSVQSIIQTTNRGEIILLSSTGNAHKLKISEMEEKQPSQIGLYLPSILQLEKDEKIIGLLSTNYTNPQQYALITFQSGSIVKIPLNSYQTKQNRSKLANSLSLDSPVISIIQIDSETDIYIESNQGKAIVFNTSILNEKKSRNSQGQQIIKSNKEGFKVTKSEVFTNQVIKEDYLVEKASAGKLL